MTRAVPSRSWLTFPVSGLLAALMVAARPFFSYHLSSDLLSQLPLIFRVADPNYLPNDPYVNEMQGFSARTVPTYVTAAIVSVTGIPTALLLQHLFALSIAAAATWIVARRAFFASEFAALFAVTLVLFVKPGEFGNGLEAVGYTPVPREIAKALCLLALAFWLTNRRALTIISLLAASIFQAAYPAGLALILCAAHLVSIPMNLSLLSRARLLVGGIFVTLVVGALVERAIFGPADGLVWLIAEFRNPHHLLWQNMGFRAYVNVFLVASTALVLLVMLRCRGVKGLLVCIGVLTFSVTAFILVDPLPTRLGLALQGGRLLFVVFFLGAIACVALLDRIVLAIRPNLYTRVEKIAGLVKSSALTKSVLLTALFLTVSILIAPLFSVSASQIARNVGYAPNRLKIGSKDTEAIALAIRALPVDALVLGPPNFGSVRVIGKRAVYVDFKAWSFTAPQKWASRMDAAYGPLDLPGGFEWLARAERAWAKTTCVELLARAARLGATHVVVQNRGEGCPKAVISAGQFMVIPVAPNPQPRPSLHR